MSGSNARRHPRFQAELYLRSSHLPLLDARVLDLSENGARLRLKAAPSGSLEGSVIRFGASLPGQQFAFFEGQARVAWTVQQEEGWEAGLEWQTLPAQERAMLESVLELLEE